MKIIEIDLKRKGHYSGIVVTQTSKHFFEYFCYLLLSACLGHINTYINLIKVLKIWKSFKYEIQRFNSEKKEKKNEKFKKKKKKERKKETARKINNLRNKQMK